MIPRGRFYSSDLDQMVRVLSVGEKDPHHALRVATYAQNMHEYQVAMCHDLLEDGLATYEQLWMNLGLFLAGSVRTLSRDKQSESYEQYIERVARSRDPIAMAVKLYDLFDHLHPERVQNLDPKKICRYVKAIRVIANSLGRYKRDVLDIGTSENRRDVVGSPVGY